MSRPSWGLSDASETRAVHQDTFVVGLLLSSCVGVCLGLQGST